MSEPKREQDASVYRSMAMTALATSKRRIGDLKTKAARIGEGKPAPSPDATVDDPSGQLAADAERARVG